MKHWLLCIVGCAMMISTSVAAAREDVSARQLVEEAVAAHGGDLWLAPKTLALVGEADFYDADAVEPGSRADDYRMWRQTDPERTAAHEAEGKVRIIAKSGKKLLFEVGFDGKTTWTEKGIMPKDQADAYWASNFGFGIIRSALAEDLVIEHAPSRTIDGHPIDMVRIVDKRGAATLFGLDRDSHFIRYLGFRTPRGWHERYYDDFVKVPETGWVQSRTVSLFYDGVLANRVLWRSVVVGESLPAALFVPPATER